MSWLDPGKQFAAPNGPCVAKPEKSEVVDLQALFGREKGRLHLMRMRRLVWQHSICTQENGSAQVMNSKR
jgi:hypothetical protein